MGHATTFICHLNILRLLLLVELILTCARHYTTFIGNQGLISQIIGLGIEVGIEISHKINVGPGVHNQDDWSRNRNRKGLQELEALEAKVPRV